MYYAEDRTSDVALDALKGAAAGAVGVWAMDRVTWWLWDREDPAALRREVRARPGGLDPAHAVANRVAGLVGTELEPRQPHPAGTAVHYALGMGPGAAYAVARRRFPAVATGAGLMYGLTLSLAEDEGMAPLLGLAGGPTEYPWQAHVRGLVGHLVLGAVTHAVLDLLDRAR
jgi:hypothetical protein